MANKTVFSGYPSAFVYKDPDGKKDIQHLLWGDWMLLKDGSSGDYRQVHARQVDGWVHKDEIQEDRLLEIVFVDIGQGDGCLVVTPENKHMVIDAGVGDNMARFLNWRYGGFKKDWEFECAVISHSDADHYGGFEEIFGTANVRFKTIYHNGIVERSGKNRLGPITSSGQPRYLSDVIRTHSQLEKLVMDPANWQTMQYSRMLKKAIDNKVCTNFKMLSAADGFMEGYGPGKELSIAVLGPVMEKDSQGNPLLRWFGSDGQTKNGHSVVLRMQYRDISLLLGGDLNIPSEELLLSHHTGLPCPAKDHEQHKLLVEAARKVFQVDIAKSCHHGSADFSTTFISALNPLVTVISSGDNEPHSHPRADTLGTIGLHSRGVRPLIFSTELARSAKESVKHPYILRKKFMDLKKELEKTSIDTAEGRKKKEKLDKEFEEMVNAIERSIAVFGAINMRTDGRKVVMAQKLEQSRNAGGKTVKWDIYCLESQGNGPLTYQSKY